MQVRPINLQQPVNRGYVHGTVVEYVNRTSIDESKRIIEDALLSHKAPDYNQIKQIMQYGEDILKKFTEFFKKCHPDTNIFIDYQENSIARCVIGNKKLPQGAIINVDQMFYTGADGKIYDLGSPKEEWQYEQFLSCNSCSMNNLYQLDLFADDLNNHIRPQNIDRELLSIAKKQIKTNLNKKSFFSRHRTMFRAEKIDIFRREIGENDSVTEEIKEIIRSGKD